MHDTCEYRPTVGLYTYERFWSLPPNTFGSSRIRARWLVPYWAEAEEWKPGRHYDILIFQKVYSPALLRAFRGIRIFDICDPDWISNPSVLRSMRLAHAIVTSTQPLAHAIQALVGDIPVRCIPDRLYLPDHVPVKTIHSPDIRRLVWFGFHQNTRYLEPSLDHLAGRRLTLTIISDKPFTPRRPVKGLTIRNVPYAYPAIHQELVAHDVAFLPHPLHDFAGRMKSNNRTQTAWALGVPVAHDCAALTRLRSQVAREEGSRRMRRHAQKNCDVRTSVEEYKTLIADLRRTTSASLLAPDADTPNSLLSHRRTSSRRLDTVHFSVTESVIRKLHSYMLVKRSLMRALEKMSLIPRNAIRG